MSMSVSSGPGKLRLWTGSSTWPMLGVIVGYRQADQWWQAQARPMLAALTGKACCCRMMGDDCWWFFSNSARSLEFSASSTE